MTERRRGGVVDIVWSWPTPIFAHAKAEGQRLATKSEAEPFRFQSVI